MGRNEASLLRAAGEKALTSATRGGSCAHPDQSRGLVPRHNMRAIFGVGASSPILHFFIWGGLALHERLVGVSVLCARFTQLSRTLAVSAKKLGFKQFSLGPATGWSCTTICLLISRCDALGACSVPIRRFHLRSAH